MYEGLVYNCILALIFHYINNFPTEATVCSCFFICCKQLYHLSVSVFLCAWVRVSLGQKPGNGISRLKVTLRCLAFTVLYEFARAAERKHHWLGGLNARNVFSQALEPGRLGPMLGSVSLSWCLSLQSSCRLCLCLHMVLPLCVSASRFHLVRTSVISVTLD